MKNLLPYFLLLLLAILCFFLFQSNRELAKLRTEDNRRAQEVIAKHRDTIKTAVARINELEVRRTHEHDSAKVAQNSAKREIEAYKKTIIRLRPTVQAKIDSFPDLRAFVAAQDYLIQQQDSLIRSQDLFCAAQIRDFNEILALHQQKFEAQGQITDALTEQLAASTKETRKQKRGKNFFKVVSGVLVGGIVYMSLKE